MTDGEGQFPLKDRLQEVRLAEIPEEPHLGETTMRLAISCAPEEGRGLVEAFKRMSLLEIMAPAAGSSEVESAADAVS